VADELFSREEIQAGGLSRVRRARALLYLIEQEARRQSDQRAIVATSAPEAGSLLAAIYTADPETMRSPLPGEADEAFLESFRNARRAAEGADTRGICNSIDDWKVLLPDDLQLRAEILHQMAIRLPLPANRTKALAAAFGVGTPEFDAAYESIAGKPSSSAFSANVGLIGWWRLGRRG
jgi:hypothetical protein